MKTEFIQMEAVEENNLAVEDYSEKNNLAVEDYSEKSFVVRGELTRQYKDSLKALGGRYNPHLKGGQGWIFSKKHQEQVVEFVLKVNSGEADVTIPSVNNELGLPTVPSPSLKTNPYQYVKYKIYRPAVGMTVTLKTDGKTVEGTVLKTDSSSRNDITDTVYIDFDGQTSLGITGRGRWEVFGLFQKHTLFFSE